MTTPKHDIRPEEVSASERGGEAAYQYDQEQNPRRIHPTKDTQKKVEPME